MEAPDISKEDVKILDDLWKEQPWKKSGQSIQFKLPQSRLQPKEKPKDKKST